MLKKKDDQKRRLEDKVGVTESIIAPGTKFKGIIIGHNNVRVFGYFKGKINCEQLVWVEKEGKIDGTIRSPFIIIEGQINGNIESAEHVELRTKGRVMGNIETNKIAIAEGSYFNGEIQRPGKEHKPISFVEKRTGKGQADSQDKSLPPKAIKNKEEKSDP
jgi:cytoskeletal protein CcmA (bactofilin family)